MASLSSPRPRLSISQAPPILNADIASVDSASAATASLAGGTRAAKVSSTVRRPSTPEQLLAATPKRYANIRKHLKYGLVSVKESKKYNSRLHAGVSERAAPRHEYRKRSSVMSGPGGVAGAKRHGSSTSSNASGFVPERDSSMMMTMTSKLSRVKVTPLAPRYRSMCDAIVKKNSGLLASLQKASLLSADVLSALYDDCDEERQKRLNDLVQTCSEDLFRSKSDCDTMAEQLKSQSSYLSLMTKNGACSVEPQHIEQLKRVQAEQEAASFALKQLVQTLQTALDPNNRAPLPRLAREKWAWIQARLRLGVLFSKADVKVARRINECFLQRFVANRRFNALCRSVARVNFYATSAR